MKLLSRLNVLGSATVFSHMRGLMVVLKNKSYVSRLKTIFGVKVIIYVTVSVLETAHLVSPCLLMVETEVEIYLGVRVLP